MAQTDKPIVWLHGEIKTPPLSRDARLSMGFNLRKLQQGDMLTMPHSRPMKEIGRRCHELREKDKGTFWRIIYRIDEDAIVILAVFSKQKNQTPKYIINDSKTRLKLYDGALKKDEKRK